MGLHESKNMSPIVGVTLFEKLPLVETGNKYFDSTIQRLWTTRKTMLGFAQSTLNPTYQLKREPESLLDPLFISGQQ